MFAINFVEQNQQSEIVGFFERSERGNHLVHAHILRRPNRLLDNSRQFVEKEQLRSPRRENHCQLRYFAAISRIQIFGNCAKKTVFSAVCLHYLCHRCISFALSQPFFTVLINSSSDTWVWVLRFMSFSVKLADCISFSPAIATKGIARLSAYSICFLSLT